MCPTSLHEIVSFVLRLEISILATASVTGPLHPCSLSPLRQARTKAHFFLHGLYVLILFVLALVPAVNGKQATNYCSNCAGQRYSGYDGLRGNVHLYHLQSKFKRTVSLAGNEPSFFINLKSNFSLNLISGYAIVNTKGKPEKRPTLRQWLT